MLDEATLQQTLYAIVKSGELHGRHLVMSGHLDADGIRAALQWQIIRKIGFMLTLPRTTRFAFYQGVNMLDDYAGPDLTPAEPMTVIMTAIPA